MNNYNNNLAEDSLNQSFAAFADLSPQPHDDSFEPAEHASFGEFAPETAVFPMV